MPPPLSMRRDATRRHRRRATTTTAYPPPHPRDIAFSFSSRILYAFPPPLPFSFLPLFLLVLVLLLTLFLSSPTPRTDCIAGDPFTRLLPPSSALFLSRPQQPFACIVFPSSVSYRASPPSPPPPLPLPLLPSPPPPPPPTQAGGLPQNRHTVVHTTETDSAHGWARANTFRRPRPRSWPTAVNQSSAAAATSDRRTGREKKTLF